jgi:hypothetical protein
MGTSWATIRCSTSVRAFEARTASWVQPQRDLDTTTPEQMRDQVRAGQHHAGRDRRPQASAPSPCPAATAWPPASDYVPGLRRPSWRSRSPEGDGVIADMAALDPYEVPVLAPVGLSGKELIAIVQRAGSRGPWSTSPSTASAATTCRPRRGAPRAAALPGRQPQDDLDRHLREPDAPCESRESRAGRLGAGLERRVRRRRARPAKWVEETGGHGFGNNELQYYTAGPRTCAWSAASW